jgi:predicted AlkP superfamily phosphohydrolase/phosphomutase/tetratricopeptide (TPR) repeat protein
MTARRVLLIGWDAADWKVIHPLMDAGKMPNVQGLVRAGAHGHIATLHPPLSPMLWTSIATGKRPFKHGIHGFSEPTPDGRGVQPVSNLSRKSKALWNIFNQNGLRSVVIGWWPSHPAEPIDGVMVSDQYHRASGAIDEGWPLPANTVHPPELADTLASLRVHPDQLTPQMVEPFIPRAREIDQDNDERLAMCMLMLAECMSMEAAAQWLIEHRAWDLFAVYFDSIDHFCHGFMRYHPPRQSWIAPRDFELYRDVVTMAYQFHDRMLGKLLERAGGDTTVVLLSDHGFHADHLRPASIPDIPAGPAIEHRELGILVMRGPGIQKDVLLHGPSVLDVTPTILALCGLPVGEDMDGKVLSQAFQEAPEVRFIPSWDAVAGTDGRHPPHTRLDPVAARAALEQMIALGYIERPDENSEVAVALTIRELRFNLGESYQDAGRHAEAYEIFRELCAADADEQRFAVRLFASCQALGLEEEMRRIAEDLDGRRRRLHEESKAKIEALLATGRARELSEDERRELARWRKLARFQPPVVDYLKAQVLTAAERYGEALDALERVTEAHLVRPGLLLQTAELYLRQHRRREARQVYEKALQIDPDNAGAHLGLCRMALRRKQFNLAAQHALDAVDRHYQHPPAHFVLGQALAGMGEYARAAEAFRAAISLNPNYPEAHARLAALLGTHLGEADLAREHRKLARRMREGGSALPARRASVVVMERSISRQPAGTLEMPPLAECLVVVTGLPRSGTSMLMQMLAAGGMPVLADGLRSADEDNPRGYLEFEPVKNLSNDAQCLLEGRGKCVKIIAPLLTALPAGLPCRVILVERDLEEVLDSQEHMLVRRNQPLEATAERRRILREEFPRLLERVKAMLAQRRDTRLLVVEHRDAIADARGTAQRVNQFLGGGLDEAAMAAAIEPSLHRNRAGLGARA